MLTRGDENVDRAGHRAVGSPRRAPRAAAARADRRPLPLSRQVGQRLFAGRPGRNCTVEIGARFIQRGKEKTRIRMLCPSLSSPQGVAGASSWTPARTRWTKSTPRWRRCGGATRATSERSSTGVSTRCSTARESTDQGAGSAHRCTPPVALGAGWVGHQGTRPLPGNCGVDRPSLRVSLLRLAGARPTGPTFGARSTSSTSAARPPCRSRRARSSSSAWRGPCRPTHSTGRQLGRPALGIPGIAQPLTSRRATEMAPRLGALLTCPPPPPPPSCSNDPVEFEGVEMAPMSHLQRIIQASFAAAQRQLPFGGSGGGGAAASARSAPFARPQREMPPHAGRPCGTSFLLHPLPSL